MLSKMSNNLKKIAKGLVFCAACANPLHIAANHPNDCTKPGCTECDKAHQKGKEGEKNPEGQKVEKHQHHNQ